MGAYREGVYPSFGVLSNLIYIVFPYRLRWVGDGAAVGIFKRPRYASRKRRSRPDLNQYGANVYPGVQSGSAWCGAMRIEL